MVDRKRYERYKAERRKYALKTAVDVHDNIEYEDFLARVTQRLTADSVFSRNNFAIEDLLGFMKKLNNKQIRYIVNRLEKGDKTIKFATIYKVTQRRIQQLYDNTKEQTKYLF
mgnify:CR=1 FL=1